jgi:hypothetical protein
MDKLKRVEILKRVLERLKYPTNASRGVCYQIVWLSHTNSGFTDNEMKEFENWFISQKPHAKLHSKFFKHITFTNGFWWWVRDKRGLEQRILFVEHLIKKHSK